VAAVSDDNMCINEMHNHANNDDDSADDTRLLNHKLF
jgi:hypothetical protein